MVMKLQRAGATAPAETTERRAPAGWGSKPTGDAAPANEQTTTAAPAEERKAPSGWGKPAGSPAAAPTEEQEQRAEIREKLNPEQQPGTTDEGSAGFSTDVIALKGQVEAGADVPFEGSQERTQSQGEAPKRTRTPKDTPPPSGLSLQDITDAVRSALNDNAPQPYVESDETRQVRYLSDTMYAAKAAADAVAALAGTGNTDAAGEVFELLFGAVEQQLKALGYGA